MLNVSSDTTLVVEKYASPRSSRSYMRHPGLNRHIFTSHTHIFSRSLFFSFSDGLSHSAKRMHETKRLDVLRNITELMSRTFPSQFVFPVLGHEDGSANFEQLGDLWRHWLPLEAVQTFEKGKSARMDERIASRRTRT